MKGVFLDLDTVSHQGDVRLRSLEKVLSVLRVFGTTPADKVLEHAADAEVVIVNKVKLPADAIKQLPAARLICVAATGVNNIDLAAAWDRKIGVCNVPAYAAASVAQHVFALLLALNQHIAGYEALLRQGAWKRAPQFTLLDYPIRELAGKRMGILGYGSIGQAVARVAEAFGMGVFLAARGRDDTRPSRLPLHELLPLVDVLSIHLPLTPETRGLIGPKELTLLKPEAILINTARGGIVDETALAAVLRAGRLAGAGVDVLSEEPPVHGNPLLDPSIPNLIVTPHVAWAARETRQRVVDEMALNIAAFQAGEQRNRVT
ncbi:MAG TPA: D-2-hydroxyacid dehydrogenase [Gammaproteobacteria bacterium]|jgi:glycerate dehydrogenase|nr:D-2-hydroxyacid dehydrogenase [Gammaproteobacteria bacterium]